MFDLLSERSVYHLPESDLADLIEIAAENTMMASGLARNILELNGIRTQSQGCDYIVMFNGGAHENETISKMEKSEKSVLVYPNPSNKIVTFSLSGDFEGARIQILDTKGAIVWNKSINSMVTRINWDHTASATGIYFYRILQDGGYHRYGKIVIQR